MSTNEGNGTGLLEMHEAHVRAWNEFDLGALGQIYDPECRIFDTIPPAAFPGLQEFLEHLTPVLHAFNRFSLRTFDRAVCANERMGWVASRYEIVARRGEGVLRRRGRWTEIYEKQGGAWKLTHLHSSDDPAR